jgi:hypothetical protein
MKFFNETRNCWERYKGNCAKTLLICTKNTAGHELANPNGLQAQPTAANQQRQIVTCPNELCEVKTKNELKFNMKFFFQPRLQAESMKP